MRSALLALVEKKWIEMAVEYFKANKKIFYFYTNSGKKNVALSNAKYVYFKLTGETCISLKAKLVDIITDNPRKFRLPGCENEIGKYYYGFEKLKWLKVSVDLNDLQHFKSLENLRHDIPGACVIVDPSFE